MSITTGMTGVAGEYYVAAELSRRGWLATVTIKNAPGTDVLAQRVDTRWVVAVQTKTSRAGDKFALKGPKTIDEPERVADERLSTAENEWYAFVGLKEEGERPDFYVVPRNVVAGMIYLNHRDWLRKPGRLRARNDGSMRYLQSAEVVGYLDRWDLLDSASSEVPFLGDPLYMQLAAEIPRPGGHPGIV
jgi:hypothetical protein